MDEGTFGGQRAQVSKIAQQIAQGKRGSGAYPTPEEYTKAEEIWNRRSSKVGEDAARGRVRPKQAEEIQMLEKMGRR
jgi:hypothetical protein